VAVVTDELANAAPGGAIDAVAVLAAEGWGVVLLPPSGAPLGVVADEVAEFLRNGMTVVLVGETAEFPELPSINPSTDQELAAFLQR
jgi:hypothetical protein